ncbi:methyltransferase [Streptomyces rochei]|nr:methyltransferase [Streptomyces rochei]WMI61832.1 methyltransferase [Streptomyces rochei]
MHDWPEEQALRILRNVRAAIKPGGKLLIAEMVIPEQGDQPHSGKLVDLWLMLLVGGRERTPGQYADLLARAGFRLERVVETAAAISSWRPSPCDHRGGRAPSRDEGTRRGPPVCAAGQRRPGGRGRRRAGPRGAPGGGERRTKAPACAHAGGRLGGVGQRGGPNHRARAVSRPCAQVPVQAT